MELIEWILQDENLDKAIQVVKRNRGADGIDKMTVGELDAHFAQHREEIKRQIREGEYKPKPVRRAYIPKANGKKRPLGIPTVVDRVVQQATAQVLSLGYDKYFSQHSYGFRPGRSCQQAVLKALEIWKHWKTPKNREKMLIKLGLNKRSAHGISYAKGYVSPLSIWSVQ